MSPDAIESVPVQLTRMEGKLSLVLQRMDDLVPRVERHEVEISEMKMTTQRLSLQAEARDQTAIALALALKDAKEATEAAARKEDAKAKAAATDAESKAALGWSPITKLFAVATGAMVLLTLYQNIIPG